MYARLGVREYFLFDPWGEHHTPRLQGYRLVEGKYEPLVAVESIDRTLTLTSEVLGLELRAKAGGKIRYRDPVTGEELLSYGETHAALRTAEARLEAEAAARRAAQRRAEREAAARRAAEARIADLEARLGEDR